MSKNLRAVPLEKSLNGVDFSVECDLGRYARGGILAPVDVDPMRGYGGPETGFFHVYTATDDFTVITRAVGNDWETGASGMFHIGHAGAVSIVCDGVALFGDVHDRSSFTWVQTQAPVREGIVSAGGEFLLLNANSGLVILGVGGEYARTERLCWEYVKIGRFDDSSVTGVIDPEVIPIEFGWDFHADRTGEGILGRA